MEPHHDGLVGRRVTVLSWCGHPRLVEPCDAITLDGVENLSDAELAALVNVIPDDSPYDHAAVPVATRTRFGTPSWRHHMPMPNIPAHHISVCL